MEIQRPPWRFFISANFKELFLRPKKGITEKQWISTLFNRFLEIPAIFILWFASKISTRAERILAKKFNQSWKLKPIPSAASFSVEATNYNRIKTLEIKKKIDAQTILLDIMSFREIVEKFPFSMIGECGCRSIIEHCDSPRNTCMFLGYAVDSTSNIENAKQYQAIPREELENLVEMTDKWALVHMTLNFPDIHHTNVVCNCCDCCCIGFRELKQHGIPLIHGSKYVARIDPSKCKGCYHCINFRCRFGAIVKVNEDGTVIDPRKEERERFKLKWHRWGESRNGWGLRIRKDPDSWPRVKAEHTGKWKARVNPSRCFGCGNCASPKYGCPEKAIQLYPRSIN